MLRVDYECKESDSDESITEIDVCLILNVQPYQNLPPLRKNRLNRVLKKTMKTVPSQINDKGPTETKNIPSDLDW